MILQNLTIKRTKETLSILEAELECRDEQKKEKTTQPEAHRCHTRQQSHGVLLAVLFFPSYCSLNQKNVNN
jgi:hypothetical protein